MKINKNNLLNIVAAPIAGMTLMAASSAQACSPEPYTGSVCITAATFCPRGYADADGRLLPISQFAALYSLLGTNYGGDGKVSFALPDLRGRSPAGIGQSPGLSPVTQGEKRGTESVTLNVNNMPAHSHSAHAANADGTSIASDNSWPANPVGDYRGNPLNSNAYAATGTEVTLNGGVIGSTGGNTPVTNLPPQLGMRYCVALEGVFPPRD